MYVYMYRCIYTYMTKLRAFQLCTLYQVFLSHAQMHWHTRSVLQLLHIKKYDYIHIALIYAYISTYTHTYIRLKALSHPGAQREWAALASRKPLAPDGKNGNKALRQMHPQGE